MIRKVIVTDWRYHMGPVLYLFDTNDIAAGSIWWDNCTWLASTMDEHGGNNHLGYFREKDDAKAAVVENLATLPNVKLLPAGMAALR